VNIIINGVPGNDMGALMNGPTIIVNDDAQDGIGNTMNGGKIVVYGNVGDALGHSMQGGVIYVKGNAGYRACIHMKEYKGMHPTVVIGGVCRSICWRVYGGRNIDYLRNKLQSLDRILFGYRNTWRQNIFERADRQKAVEQRCKNSGTRHER